MFVLIIATSLTQKVLHNLDLSSLPWQQQQLLAVPLRSRSIAKSCRDPTFSGLLICDSVRFTRDLIVKKEEERESLNSREILLSKSQERESCPGISVLIDSILAHKFNPLHIVRASRRKRIDRLQLRVTRHFSGTTRINGLFSLFGQSG